MFPYSLTRLQDPAQIQAFRAHMVHAGLIAPSQDFLASAKIFGLSRSGDLVGGFVYSASPRRIFSVLSEDAANATKAAMHSRSIAPESVHELSSLWAAKSVGFVGRFFLMICSALVAFGRGTSHVVLMCRKAKLTKMYENGRPVILHREADGQQVERVYLFSRAAFLRALALYPVHKAQRALRTSSSASAGLPTAG